MFNTVQIIMDVFGRPIFVLPVEPSESDCSVTVEEAGVDFFSGHNRIGSVEVSEPAILALVAMQPQVGIIAWDDTKTAECPSVLTHIAQVVDKRN